MIKSMTKLNVTDLQEFIKNPKVILAFVNETSILSTSTLRILKELECDCGIKIGYIDVEENKECFSKFSLRIIPSIHLYELGNLATKITLPFTKKDLECLVR